MMRIKEAIQRRRLIQQLNDEYADIDEDPNYGAGKPHPNVSLRQFTPRGDGTTGDSGENFCRHDSIDISLADHHRAYLQLQEFVQQLKTRLSDGQQRALRVTWKRLCEAPKTSGRGNLRIMEKVFNQLVQSQANVMSVFYRSAFLKCIDDRLTGCQSGTIATLRDHAHLLIDLIDGIMSVMFEAPLARPVWDPATIGRAHTRLIPLGFERRMWHKLGEVLAEVMFSQECIRAYPHAASAWSVLSVAITEKMYSHNRVSRGHDSNWQGYRIALCASALTSQQADSLSSQTASPVIQKKTSASSLGVCHQHRQQPAGKGRRKKSGQASNPPSRKQSGGKSPRRRSKSNSTRRQAALKKASNRAQRSELAKDIENRELENPTTSAA